MPKECYFILDRHLIPKHNSIIYDEETGKIKTNLKDQIKINKSLLYQAFLKDPTINVVDIQIISFAEKGFAKTFLIYRYNLKRKQSCYSNAHNPYMSTRNILNLIRDAKKIKTYPGAHENYFKEILALEKYSPNLELLFLSRRLYCSKLS